jgi:osmotically inducible protein OsmC
MTISKAQAIWTGTLKEGRGTVKGGNGFFDAPYTFLSRFEGQNTATTPEELIGAAHAGCFSMYLAAQLTAAGFTPNTIETAATVHLGAGPLVTKIELDTIADVPGVDDSTFVEKVEVSKKNCPISKALAAVPEIVINVTRKS